MHFFRKLQYTIPSDSQKVFSIKEYIREFYRRVITFKLAIEKDENYYENIKMVRLIML